MKPKIHRESNWRNLDLISGVMRDVHAFPFFGTLLGLNREKNLIAGDDDIDFYVRDDKIKSVIEAIRDLGFELDCKRDPNLTPHFKQAVWRRDNQVSLVDFYVFTEDSEFIYDRWNFKGNTKPAHTLKIPKKFIFPLVPAEIAGVKILMPQNPDEICEFLYGKDWRVPKQKGVEYEVFIHNNTPFIAQTKTERFLCEKIKSLEDEIYSLTRGPSGWGRAALLSAMRIFRRKGVPQP
jgi:hypothetical protein